MKHVTVALIVIAVCFGVSLCAKQPTHPRKNSKGQNTATKLPDGVTSWTIDESDHRTNSDKASRLQKKMLATKAAGVTSWTMEESDHRTDPGSTLTSDAGRVGTSEGTYQRDPATTTTAVDDERPTNTAEDAVDELGDGTGSHSSPKNLMTYDQTDDNSPEGISEMTPSLAKSDCPTERSTAIRNLTVSSVGPTWIHVHFQIECDNSTRYNVGIDQDGQVLGNDKINETCLIYADNSINLNLTSDGECSLCKLQPCTNYRINISTADGEGETLEVEQATISATTESVQVDIHKIDMENTMWNLTWDPLDSDLFQVNPRWCIGIKENGASQTIFDIPASCIVGGVTVKQNALHCFDSNGTRTLVNDSLLLRPCVSYSVAAFPAFGEQECALSWKDVGPLYYEAPGEVNPNQVHINDTGKDIVIHLNKVDIDQCRKKYEVAVKVRDSEDATRSLQEDVNAFVFRNAQKCTTYQFSITSVGYNGNRTTSIDHTTRSVALPEVQVELLERENEQKVKWRFAAADFSDWQCVTKVQILYKLTQSSDTYWTHSMEKDGTTFQTEWTISDNIYPGRYEFKVEVSLVNSWKSASKVDFFDVLDPYAGTTSALIAIMIILIIVVIVVGVYVAEPSVYHRLAESICRSKRSSNGIMMQRLPQRRSHPIRVRDVPSVTRRMCLDANRELENEFEDVRLISESHVASKNEATKPTNKLKNRYVNILPFDDNRVVLSTLPDEPDSDYINASYIMGFNGPKEYIASQGPKECTLADWWRMIWEQDCRVIVMVTALEERGKTKCHRYWPDASEENVATYGEVNVKVTETSSQEICTLRTFQVTLNEEVRIVKQFYLNNWPDFGCPENPEVLIGFIEAVRCELAKSIAAGPLLVHCSAGVGRTGTFIAVDWLMQEARAFKEIDVFAVVLRMRQCRVNMVQTEDQYEFVYQCISRYVMSRLHQENGIGHSSAVDNADESHCLV